MLPSFIADDSSMKPTRARKNYTNKKNKNYKNLETKLNSSLSNDKQSQIVCDFL